MQVRIFPGGSYEELGAERYAVDWYTLKPDYVENEDESPDPDFDMFCNTRVFKSLEAAKCEAMKLIDEDYFGAPIIRKQVVEWYVEEDRIAEWNDVGDPIYVE